MVAIKTNPIKTCENLFDMETESCKKQNILLKVILDIAIGGYKRILPLTGK